MEIDNLEPWPTPANPNQASRPNQGGTDTSFLAIGTAYSRLGSASRKTSTSG